MKLTLKAIIGTVLLMVVMFSACGSLDDGTVYISKITRLTPEEVIAGPFAGKNKIELTDKDGYLSFFYNDDEFVLGDSLVYVPVSDKVALTEFKIMNSNLVDLLELITNKKDSVISTLTSELQLTNNFKTQITVLMNELEEGLALISEDDSNEN